MDALRVSSLGSTPLNALRPPPVVPQVQTGAPGNGRTELTVGLVPDLARDLALTLLQSSTQSALLRPVTGSAPAPPELAPTFTASLVAALTAPPTTAVATPSTETASAAGAPAVAGSTPAPTTAPTTPTVAALAPETPAIQDGFQTGASVDFALQTALRFGAGVVAQAAPALQAASLDDGLVRDAMAVLRQGGLQSQGGRPGPEAYARPQTDAMRAAETYRPTAPEVGSGVLNLLA